MSKIPCRECPECGKYHDITHDECDECGGNLTQSLIVLLDPNEINRILYGQIDNDAKAYVQKCPACGTMNYSMGDTSCSICYKCHKKRISSVKRIPVSDELDPQIDDDNKKIDEDDLIEVLSEDDSKSDSKNDSNDDVLDSAALTWATALRDRIGSAVSMSDHSVSYPDVNIDSNNRDLEENQPSVLHDSQDDDDDTVGWGFLGEISGYSDIEPKTDNIKDITLTAMTYGQLSFTVEAKPDCEYLLGRSAMQSEFLSMDPRVGNEHCYLKYKNGQWYVKDNHSANGTAINSRDIGLNGEHILHDGDELKLGHHNNSMAFKITI